MSKTKILKTGLTEFDERIGLKEGHLVLLGSRPSMGKTALAMTLINNICKNKNCECIYFSLEQSKEQFARRLLKMNCRIDDFDKLNAEKINDDDWERITAESERISKTNLYLDDTAGNTVEEIIKKAQECFQKTPVSLIVVDYIELVGNPSNMSREDEVEIILNSLKELAEEMQCTVLVLSQLARFEFKRSNKRPTVEDFPHVNFSKVHVDEILLLYRDEYYDKDSDRKGIAEVHAIKPDTNDDDIVELRFVSKYSVFENLQTVPAKSFSIKDADKKLKDVCMEGLKERFGECPADAVKNRLFHELGVVARNHHSSYYLLASMLSKEAERLHHAIFFRGAINSSLIAYTCGISEINPMEKEYGGINLPFESTREEYGKMQPCIDVQCTMAFIMFAQSFLCREFPEYRFLVYPLKSEDYSMVRASRLYILRPEELPTIDPVDIEGSDLDEYPDFLFFDDYFHITFIGDNQMELMRYNKYYEPHVTFDEKDSEKVVSALWKNVKKFDKDFKDYRKLKVQTYEELIRVESMAHSTGVWGGILKEMVLDGRLAVAEVIGSRDDLFLYLVKIGFDRQEAFWISNRVRKGKHLTDEQLRKLEDNGAEEWVIDLCARVLYLFPKAHVAQLIRKDAFCLNKPANAEGKKYPDHMVTRDGFCG